MMWMATNYGSRIAHWLSRSGLSKSEVARRMGRDRTTVGKVLRGARQPSTGLLEEFAKVFGISVVAMLAPPPDESSRPA